MKALMVLLTAAGKTTFLDSLRKYYPEALLVSEPINKWQNIPAEKEVVKENTCVLIVTQLTRLHTGWYHCSKPSTRWQPA